MLNVEIINATVETITNYGFCGFKDIKQKGYQRKIEWLKKRFDEGLKFKILKTPTEEAIGFIEYIPGEYTWRPVEASGYFVIHCIMIYRKQYKGQGYGALLLEDCLADAEKSKKAGVVVATSQGTWMARSDLFLKHGFETTDTAPPSYELLVKKLKRNGSQPSFIANWDTKAKKLGKGLVIVQSDQCPCVAKSSLDIQECAKDYGLPVKVVCMENCEQARNAPSAYGIFNIVYDGKLIADHPISRKRFSNIMTRIRK